MGLETPEKDVLADLEYCKELKINGLPSKANTFYYILYPNTETYYVKLIHFTRLTKLFPLSSEFIRAVTLAELGEWLPMEITLDNKQLKIYFEKVEDGWDVGYKDENGIKILSFKDKKEANARAKCFLWIVENYERPSWFKGIKSLYWRPIVLRKPYPRNKKDKSYTIDEWFERAKKLDDITRDTRRKYKERIDKALEKWGLTKDDVILVENADPLWKGRAGRTDLELQAVRIAQVQPRRKDKVSYVLWLVPLKEPKGGN